MQTWSTVAGFGRTAFMPHSRHFLTSVGVQYAVCAIICIFWDISPSCYLSVKTMEASQPFITGISTSMKTNLYGEPSRCRAIIWVTASYPSVAVSHSKPCRSNSFLSTIRFISISSTTKILGWMSLSTCSWKGVPAVKAVILGRWAEPSETSKN